MRTGVVVVLATLGSAAVAHATPTSVSLTGGPLAVAGPEVHDVAVLSVDGTAQVVEAPMKPFAVTDARGSGQGWVLHLHATALREWAGTAYVAGGEVLPNWSMTLPGLSVTANTTDSTAPHVVAGPHHLDGPPVKVATAAAGSGMGRFSFTPIAALQIALPAHADPAMYRSQLSVTVTSGP